MLFLFTLIIAKTKRMTCQNLFCSKMIRLLFFPSISADSRYTEQKRKFRSLIETLRIQSTDDA